MPLWPAGIGMTLYLPNYGEHIPSTPLIYWNRLTLSHCFFQTDRYHVTYVCSIMPSWRSCQLVYNCYILLSIAECLLQEFKCNGGRAITCNVTKSSMSGRSASVHVFRKVYEEGVIPVIMDHGHLPRPGFLPLKLQPWTTLSAWPEPAVLLGR